MVEHGRTQKGNQFVVPHSCHSYAPVNCRDAHLEDELSTLPALLAVVAALEVSSSTARGMGVDDRYPFLS